MTAPRPDDPWHTALELHRQGRLDEARHLYLKVLSAQPGHLQALQRLGVLACQLGEYDNAVATLQAALRAAPGHADLWCNLAMAQLELRLPADALASTDRALALDEALAPAWFNRGLALRALGRAQPAVLSLDRAVTLKPDHARAWATRGHALQDLGRFDEAVRSHDRALALDPALQEAWFGRANVLLDAGRADDAVASFDRLLALRPGHPQAHHNRALALMQRRRWAEAADGLRQALAQGLTQPALRAALARALLSLRQFDAALAEADRALAQQPALHGALRVRASALQALGRFDEAVAAFGQAIGQRPQDVALYNDRGNALRAAGRLREAVDSYRQALDLDPGFEFLHGTWLFTRMRRCDWDGIDAELDRLRTDIAHGRKACTPFPALSLVDDPALHREVARTWVRAKLPARATAAVAAAAGPLPPPPVDGGRIRVAYCSADFHEHATSILMADLFEQHDRGRFEWVALSFGPDRDDPLRRRVRAAFDHFLDVRGRPDADVVRLARQMGVHIAVDLKGHTRDARPGLFASRCAPLQVNYLGYPGTMGLPAMDYLVADRTVLPPGDAGLYDEQPVWLPGCYQPNDRHRSVGGRVPSRADLGLPDPAFVFCCFNAVHKITPATFEGWLRILQAVPGSVLWLLDAGPDACNNLRREALRRGADPARLVFAPHQPLPEHLARHARADLFLDTLPCNAHTTASDALWAGLPVLTCLGRSFPARVGASLLQAVGLPELVTTDPADYEARAVALARQPGELAALRQRLQRRPEGPLAPLFDTLALARQLEAAYTQMVQRWRAGLSPAAIDLATGQL